MASITVNNPGGEEKLHPLQHTKLHTWGDNAHTKPVQGTKPGTSKLEFGVAQRSGVEHFDHPVMVAFSMKSEFEPEKRADALYTTVTDLHCPARVFSDEELAELRLPPVLPTDRKTFDDYKFARNVDRTAPVGAYFRLAEDKYKYKDEPVYLGDWSEHEAQLREEQGLPPLRRPRSKSLSGGRAPSPPDTPEARRDVINDLKASALALHDKDRVTPTDEDVYQQWYLALLTLNGVNGTQPRARQIFRDYLRYALHWEISLQRITDLLCGAFKQVSFGQFPIDVDGVSAPVAYKERDKLDKKAAKDNEHKNEKERRKAEALKFYKPKHADSTIPIAKLPQVEDTKVRLTALNDPNLRAFFTFGFTFNYKDDTKDKQPKHVGYIRLNADNCRINRPTNVDADGYTRSNTFEPTFAIHDVTGRSYIPLLRKMFPHVRPTSQDKENKVPEYFDSLMAQSLSESKYYLVTVYMNDMPWTSNIFSNYPGMPKDHGLVKQIMRFAANDQEYTVVNFLVRSSSAKASIENMFHTLNLQATLDPWVHFYQDPFLQQLSVEGLKPYLEMPKFKVDYLSSFSTFKDYLRTIWIGDFISQEWQADDREGYKADATFLAAPRTYSQNIKRALSYFVVLHVQYPKNKPRLTEGDQIRLHRGQAHPELPIAWKGVITYTSAASEMGTVTAIIDRPRKDGVYLDLDALTDFHAEDVRRSSPQELLTQAQDKKKKPVTIFRVGHRNELKRHLKAARNFHMGPKEILLHPAQHVHIEMWKAFLQCTDHETLPRESLWSEIPEDSDIRDVVDARILPHQQHAYEYFDKDGIVARHGAILGPSGSGKSHLGRLLASPFMIEVDVPIDIYTQLYRARARYIGLDVAESEAGDNKENEAQTEKATWENDNGDGAFGNANDPTNGDWSATPATNKDNNAPTDNAWGQGFYNNTPTGDAWGQDTGAFQDTGFFEQATDANPLQEEKDSDAPDFPSFYGESDPPKKKKNAAARKAAFNEKARGSKAKGRGTRPHSSTPMPGLSKPVGSDSSDKPDESNKPVNSPVKQPEIAAPGDEAVRLTLQNGRIIVRERGRILQLAQNNATVEDMHTKVIKQYNEIRAARDQGRGLYIRLYPQSIEASATAGAVDPLFDQGPEAPFNHVDSRVPQGKLEVALDEHFTRESRLVANIAISETRDILATTVLSRTSPCLVPESTMALTSPFVRTMVTSYIMLLMVTGSASSSSRRTSHLW